MNNNIKEEQYTIYTDLFQTDNINYDNFLLSPNDYLGERCFDRLKPSHGDKVLEIGIGIRSFLARAVNKYKIIPFGLDYVSTSLKAQNQNSPFNLNLCRADGELLPYKENSFDIIVAISVLEHFSDYNAAFKEIYRVLKTDGKCLLQFPCKDFKYSLFAKFKTYDDLKNEKWFIDNQESIGHDFQRIPTRTGWKQLATQNNLHISFERASDVLLDSWMMYYFFHFIKKVQSSVIRLKGQSNIRKEKPQLQESNNSFITRQPEKIITNNLQQSYSKKRKIVGFIWYELILRGFWILGNLVPMLHKLPIGAGVYLFLKKPPNIFIDPNIDNKTLNQA